MACLQVLQYAIPTQCAASSTDGNQPSSLLANGSTCSFMQAVDQALPAALLEHLQHAFRPGAPFWQQHAYGRVGYFSYFFELVSGVTHTLCRMADTSAAAG